MSENKPIQLGLCCLNTVLRNQKPPVFASRSIILRTFKEKGIDHLKDKIIQNLLDTIKMIHWNEKHGIKVFRLSSELFPHKSNPQAPDYSFEFAEDLLKHIGDLSKKYNQRITFHPGQFNVIGTPNKQVFENTMCDLKYHADVLDLMGLGKDSVLVIHGGGVYGNKKETIMRWCEQFKMLPENVQKRVVIENCEKNFSIEDCLDVSEILNIPVVFDTHHFECYKILHPDEKFLEPDIYMHPVLDTWWRNGKKPKFHVSEQGTGKCGHHSDFIENIPDYLLEIPDKFGCDIDIMIEAKMKEQAIFKLYRKYPFLNCKKDKVIPGMQWTKTFAECDCC